MSLKFEPVAHVGMEKKKTYLSIENFWGILQCEHFLSLEFHTQSDRPPLHINKKLQHFLGQTYQQDRSIEHRTA